MSGRLKNVATIAIAGMGGIGKTTLARSVYNDERVENSFDLKAWVHVSERSDVFKMTKTIYESIVLCSCDINYLNVLQLQLERVLREKKFLLVLDDMWDESVIDWDLLQIPFQTGSRGSAIIVTTCSQSVLSSVPLVVHSLKPLGIQDSWSIFARHAFRKEALIDVDSPLKSIGERIVEKCQGLPLDVFCVQK